ncbi:hypothetical protein EPH_0059330 [Eimeria praecox]|uniref:Uncharacterized protein n=1 Tax=Eimeria praecox TaxID=51316 RepID=U6H7C9_9EIME|nr:hypothetical protein EPH_0059330 [Eimeria praecox]
MRGLREVYELFLFGFVLLRMKMNRLIRRMDGAGQRESKADEWPLKILARAVHEAEINVRHARSRMEAEMIREQQLQEKLLRAELEAMEVLSCRVFDDQQGEPLEALRYQ